MEPNYLAGGLLALGGYTLLVYALAYHASRAWYLGTGMMVLGGGVAWL